MCEQRFVVIRKNQGKSNSKEKSKTESKKFKSDSLKYNGKLYD